MNNLVVARAVIHNAIKRELDCIILFTSGKLCIQLSTQCNRAKTSTLRRKVD